MAARVSEGLGSGTSLLVAISAMSVQAAVIGLTSTAWVTWAAFSIGSFWSVVWNVITVSLRQQVIPDELLGRVNSVYRFFGWGMMPIGSLVGGAIVFGTAQIASRGLALRMPIYVEAVVLLGVFVAARSRLSTAQIEAARAAGPARHPA